MDGWVSWIDDTYGSTDECVDLVGSVYGRGGRVKRWMIW